MPNKFGPGFTGFLETDAANNLKVAALGDVEPANGRIDRFASTTGAIDGSINATGDYSGTADIFYVQPPVDENYALYRMIVTIEDSGTFDAENYGAFNAELTNGITVRVVNDDDGVVEALTDGLPIKANVDWGTYCYDVDLKTWGVGDTVLLVRWTFTRDSGPILLRGSKNERLEIVLNDNFTGLVSHLFCLNGKKVTVTK